MASTAPKTPKDHYKYPFSPLPQEDSFHTSSILLEVRSSSTSNGLSHPSPHKGSDDVYTRFIAFTFVLFFTTYVILASRFHPHKIVLLSNSFSVTNLTVSSSEIGAVWEAKFKFEGQGNCSNSTSECPDCKTELHYEAVKVSIYYKDEYHVIASASVKPFNLGMKEQMELDLDFGSSAWMKNPMFLRNEVAGKLVPEIEGGMVHLGMKMDMDVSFIRWGCFWRNMFAQTSFCWNLMVKVEPKTGMGSLVVASENRCPSDQVE